MVRRRGLLQGLSQQQGLSPIYALSTWQVDFTKNGYRLPTEAEWKYAGRGGQHNPYYIYPWGSDADTTRANWPESDTPCATRSYPWTTPVGFYNGQLHTKAAAPGSIASAFGSGLTGDAVTVTDSTGTQSAAQVLYASATQVNFVVPPVVATGQATVTVSDAGIPSSVGTVLVEDVARGLLA